MVVVWTNGFTVQIPADVWCREASDLDSEKFYFIPINSHKSIIINIMTEPLTLNEHRLKSINKLCVRVIHLEVNPTEASLLYSEVWRDLQEARSVTFLLDS